MHISQTLHNAKFSALPEPFEASTQKSPDSSKSATSESLVGAPEDSVAYSLGETAEPNLPRELRLPGGLHLSLKRPLPRLSQVAKNFLIGSAPGLGALGHIAGTGYVDPCPTSSCQKVSELEQYKEALGAVGLVANIAGTAALGAAAVLGGGPVLGAVAGVALYTSSLSLVFTQRNGSPWDFD